MQSTQKTVPTICGFCHTNCGMLVSVKDGRIDKVRGNPEHPVSRGKLCPKGAAAKQVVYAPQRLQYPLWKTEAGFKRISWDEALDRIATKLLELRDKHGPETLLQGRGAPVTTEVMDGFVQLMAAYGSPNITGPGHLCSVPRRMGMELVFGSRPCPDYQKANSIIVWAANPTDSRSYGEEMAYDGYFKVIPEAKKRGAKLIVIDPRYTEMAAMADEWVQIAPETDMAFGLAMLNVIINEQLYDKEFVANWTIGFDKLKQYVQETTPEWAEGIVQVPADRIRKIARMYAATKPAAILDGNGLDQHPNVVQTVRVIGMLIAITGNTDIPGGNIFPPRVKASAYPTMRPPIKNLDFEKYPLFPRTAYPSIFDALITGKPYQPRAMIIHHANPLLINANEKKVRQALEKLELLIVYDLFETATAQLAHVILPAASDFERYAYAIYSSAKGAFVALQQKVIEPVGESRSVFDVEYELAKRMGLEKHFPWKTNTEWVDYKLKPLGLTTEDLKKQTVIYITPPVEYGKYLKNGFNTLSMKVELYSEKLANLGQDPMPVYKPHSESREIMSRFPLVGTTRRPGIYTHTRFRNVRTLSALQPDPLIRINPDDAQLRGISEGDMVSIESPQGCVNMKVKVSTETCPGLVIADFGWGNPWDKSANINILTSDEMRCPLSSATPNRRFRCEVTKSP